MKSKAVVEPQDIRVSMSLLHSEHVALLRKNARIKPIAPKPLMAEKGAFATNKDSIDILTSIDEVVYHFEDKIEQDMFRFIGGRGRLQWIMFILNFLVQLLLQFPLAMQSLFAAGPIGMCPVAGSKTVFEECTEAEACEQIRKGLPARLEMEESWTKTYGMVCEKRYLRSTFSSLYLLIELASATVVLQTADWIGRKECFYAAFVAVCISSLGCHFSDSYGWKVIFNGMTYSGNIIYACLFTIYLTETIEPSYYLHQYIVAGWVLAYQIGYIIFCLITFVTSNPNTLSLISTISVCISALLPCLFVIESPLFALLQKSVKDFVQACKDIRKFNGLEITEDLETNIERQGAICKLQIDAALSELNNVKASEMSPLTRLLTDKLYIFQLIVLSLLQALVISIFLAGIFNMEQMGDSSATINGIIVNLTQIISGLGIAVLLHKLSRRQWILWMQGIILVATALLALARFLPKSYWLELWVTILATWIIFPIQNAIYVPFSYYTYELFPVDLRGTSGNIVNVVGIGLSMAIIYFIEYWKSIGFHPIVGAAVLCIITFPLTFLLRETV